MGLQPSEEAEWEGDLSSGSPVRDTWDAIEAWVRGALPKAQAQVEGARIVQAGRAGFGRRFRVRHAELHHSHAHPRHR